MPVRIIPANTGWSGLWSGIHARDSVGIFRIICLISYMNVLHCIMIVHQMIY